MKTTSEPYTNKIKKFVIRLIIFIIFMAMLFGIYYFYYKYTYENIMIKVDENATVEYGEEAYNLKDFIKEVNGEIISMTNIDTNIVGSQVVTLEVQKYNVVKELSFNVEVIDVVAPIITLKESELTITSGDDIDLLSNIESVNDKVDGDIAYLLSNSDSDKYYYTINTDLDNNTAGTYTVEVKAVDKSNNVSTSSFTVNVEEPVIQFRNAPSITYGGGLVNTAESLVGSPYVSGGTTPAGFDCSGFVQYVYRMNGINISRSSYTQVYDGANIDYQFAEPGDILIWGYPNGTITHSALYVGNDTMIHAANPSQGVLRSSVSGWTRGSNVVVLYTVRVNR